MNYVIDNYTVTKQEISNAFDMEERVREYLSGIWGTNPGDSQCKQLFQYLIEEREYYKEWILRMSLTGQVRLLYSGFDPYILLFEEVLKNEA